MDAPTPKVTSSSKPPRPSLIHRSGTCWCYFGSCKLSLSRPELRRRSAQLWVYSASEEIILARYFREPQSNSTTSSSASADEGYFVAYHPGPFHCKSGSVTASPPAPNVEDYFSPQHPRVSPISTKTLLH